MMVARQRAIVKKSILYGFSDPPASASLICIFFAIHWMEHTTWSNKRESTNKPHGMRSEVFLGWCFLDFRDFAAQPRWYHDSAWFSDANTMEAITPAIYECSIINKDNRTDQPPEPQLTHQPYTWPKNLLFSKIAKITDSLVKIFPNTTCSEKNRYENFWFAQALRHNSQYRRRLAFFIFHGDDHENFNSFQVLPNRSASLSIEINKRNRVNQANVFSHGRAIKINEKMIFRKIWVRHHGSAWFFETKSMDHIA